MKNALFAFLLAALGPSVGFSATVVEGQWDITGIVCEDGPVSFQSQVIKLTGFIAFTGDTVKGKVQVDHVTAGRLAEGGVLDGKFLVEGDKLTSINASGQKSSSRFKLNGDKLLLEQNNSEGDCPNNATSFVEYNRRK